MVVQGHTAHEYTSASAMKQIFSFFDAMAKLDGNEAIKDQSLVTQQETKEEDSKMQDDTPSEADKGKSAKEAHGMDENEDQCQETKDKEAQKQSVGDKMEVDNE